LRSKCHASDGPPSRHLIDRLNPQSVSFNALGPRVLRHFALDQLSLDVRGDIEKVVRREFIDYSWMTGLHVVACRPVSTAVSLFGRGDFETYGVHRAIASRSKQNGKHLDVGLHIKGAQGAVELFAGWEQVVDAYPLERASQRWAFIGLHLARKQSASPGLTGKIPRRWFANIIEDFHFVPCRSVGHVLARALIAVVRAVEEADDERYPAPLLPALFRKMRM
jgi:hypothetical protein